MHWNCLTIQCDEGLQEQEWDCIGLVLQYDAMMMQYDDRFSRAVLHCIELVLRCIAEGLPMQYDEEQYGTATFRRLQNMAITCLLLCTITITHYTQIVFLCIITITHT